MSADRKYAELKSLLGEIYDLKRLSWLSMWDQQTMMPPKGTDARSSQLATLERITHEKLVSDEVGRLLDDLRDYEESRPPDSDEASLIRVARRDYEKARRVPSDLRAEMIRAEVLALPDWAEARSRSDFSLFLPHLEKHLELKHRYIACFDGAGPTYDILLDDYQEEAKSAEVTAVFARLKQELIPLIGEIGRSDQVETGFMHGDFPVAKQDEFGRSVIERLGFSSDSWRLDPTIHPFATSIGISDIRLTTRYSENDVESIFHTVHEFGHGLYERGIDPALDRTPLCELNSMGLHESQSRLWENLVGRSRPFWRFFFPRLQELFPKQLREVEADDFYRAVNEVEPGFIRVDADEVTYNLHIILRYELEQEMIAEKLSVGDLPEAWNARMKDYLGLDVPDDARGVLQDIHWSSGSIGYFPTYLLGSVVSLQIWERVREAIPDLDAQMEAGEVGELAEWLRENLYRHGRKYTPDEMLRRLVGGPLDAEPYLRYLKGKTAEIYGVPVG